MQFPRVMLIASLVLMATLAVHAMPQGAPLEPELDNDVIPREPQAPQQPSSEKPSTPAGDSTPAASDVSPADVKPTEKPASKPKPAQESFFTRLLDDFIQIPIAALRAVNQLLNNINLRSRHAAASSVSNSTATPSLKSSI